MQETVDFLIRHGYSVVFITVFAQQLGIPVPSPPLLLAAGALAGTGRMNFWLLAALTLVASTLGDFIWYEIGRRRGGKVLRFLCRIALEPDLCVRKTEDTFARQGERALLYAKFIPGLSTMAPPLAGIVGMRPARFLLLTTLGAVIYFGLFIVLGFIFSDQLERVAARAADLGAWLGVILGGALAAYIAWKSYARWRFIRGLRVARITVDELNRMLTANEQLVVVDLRHALETAGDKSLSIPGAIRLTPEKIEEGHHRIPRDRDIVLFCT